MCNSHYCVHNYVFEKKICLIFHFLMWFELTGPGGSTGPLSILMMSRDCNTKNNVDKI